MVLKAARKTNGKAPPERRRTRRRSVKPRRNPNETSSPRPRRSIRAPPSDRRGPVRDRSRRPLTVDAGCRGTPVNPPRPPPTEPLASAYVGRWPKVATGRPMARASTTPVPCRQAMGACGPWAGGPCWWGGPERRAATGVANRVEAPVSVGCAGDLRDGLFTIRDRSCAGRAMAFDRRGPFVPCG
jgi:hypothetical protein